MRRATAAVGLFLAAAVSASLIAQDAASRLAGITAAQHAVERDFAASLFSPFTAVASRYFTSDDTARLILGADAPTFEQGAAGNAAVDVVFDGRNMWVSPVAGGPALALVKQRGDNATVDPGAGRPLTARTRMSDQDLVHVGSYYLETGARPGTGRAIVYDPGAALRKAFTGLRWFPPSIAFQVKASYTPIERADPIVVTTSRGLEKDYFRTGTLSFNAGGRALRLVALATSASPAPGDELFVPFRDATTGNESYAVGRYLTIPFKGASADYLVDFNLATNPYCAYSPHYNCVIPPKENTLPVAIRAGEMVYANHPIGGE